MSWDHYHFTTSGDRPGSSATCMPCSAPYGTQPAIAFWQIVLSVQHGPYRALTENELRYEAMQTLVFGASGLVYFTYWLPERSELHLEQFYNESGWHARPALRTC